MRWNEDFYPIQLIVIWPGLEVLMGKKLSGHSDTLTEASNIMDEI